MEKVREQCRRFVGHLWFELSILPLILISVVLLGEEIIAAPGSSEMAQVIHIQEAITVVFLVELVIRWLAAEDTRHFLKDCYLDILAVCSFLPFLRVFSLMRLLRLLRLVRVAKALRLAYFLRSHSSFAHVAQGMVTLTTLLCALVLGTLGLAWFENRGHGIRSLVNAFWDSIFCFFSAQYVHDYPATLGGRLTSLFVIGSGLAFFAVMTGTVTAVMSGKLKEGGRLLEEYLLREMRNHVVLCGWNQGCETTLRELLLDRDLAERDIVIVADLDHIPPLPNVKSQERVKLLRDDYTRVAALERAGIQHAAVAIIVSDISHNRTEQDADARTVLCALTIEKLNPEVYTCAELSSSENESHLRMGKVNEILITGELSGSLMAQAAVSSCKARILHQLIHPSFGCRLAHLPVTPELAGRDFSEVLSELRRSQGMIPVAILAGGSLRINPDKHQLSEGDVLYCITGSSEEKSDPQLPAQL